MAIDDVHIALERATLLANAQRENDALAAFLSLRALHIIPTTEAVLTHLVEDLATLHADNNQQPRATDRLFAEPQAMLSWSRFSGLYDASGRRMIGSNGAPEQMAISAAADQRMHIGAPLQLGAGGSWVIPFTRQVAGSDCN
jgi:hypothetical protein